MLLVDLFSKIIGDVVKGIQRYFHEAWKLLCASDIPPASRNHFIVSIRVQHQCNICISLLRYIYIIMFVCVCARILTNVMYIFIQYLLPINSVCEYCKLIQCPVNIEKVINNIN